MGLGRAAAPATRGNETGVDGITGGEEGVELLTGADVVPLANGSTDTDDEGVSGEEWIAESPATRSTGLIGDEDDSRVDKICAIHDNMNTDYSAHNETAKPEV